MSSLIVLTLMYILTTFSCDATMLEKEGFDPKKIFFYLESEDYDSFLLMSTCVIDRSLLIKRLVESDFRVALINYPLGWGKTMNLDMTKLFLKLEVDKQGVPLKQNDSTNYHLFMRGELILKGKSHGRMEKPFLISKEKAFCDKYQGKYPTIYINLSGMTGTNAEELMTDMKRIMSDTFDDHGYLLEVFDKVIDSHLSTDKQKKIAEEKRVKFVKYYRGNMDEEELLNCVRFLSDHLYEHFKKPSYVFIDNYEFPLKYIMETIQFTEKEQDIYIDFFAEFIKRTFDPAAHVKQGFVTCTLKLMTDIFFSPLKNFVDYNFMDNELGEFYGLSYEDVEDLFSHAKTPLGLRKKGHNYFNGYGNSTDRKKRRYNTLAIVTYLFRHYYMDCFSVDPEQVYDNFERFFLTSEFREAVGKMINGSDVEILKAVFGNLTISKDEFTNVKTLLRFEDPAEPKLIMNAAFKCMFSHGYLSLKDSSSNDPRYLVNSSAMVIPPMASDETVVVRLASKEVARDIETIRDYPPSGMRFGPDNSENSIGSF